jgi:uncharacterized protein with GYD domain
MAHFLVQVAYNSDAWAAMLKKPQDRVAIVSKAVAKLGGTVEGGWLSFGDYDIVVILRMPNNVSAAAFSMAVAAGGACKSVKTTPLLTTKEALAAEKKAAASGYTPPATQN